MGFIAHLIGFVGHLVGFLMGNNEMCHIVIELN
jgi:hypothetical protein